MASRTHAEAQDLGDNVEGEKATRTVCTVETLELFPENILNSKNFLTHIFDNDNYL